ncbi:MAG: IS256 family transposase [Deltaproteobacteria bacterium]|nr:IS256 family transposase [Deltaproteobacteria bacterium]
MREATCNSVQLPQETISDALTEVLREGARKMLAQAIEAEVSDYIERFRSVADEKGHRMVVRNGYHPERKIQTGLGAIDVKAPKINDKRVDEDGCRKRFTSQILPPYLRKTKALEELVPWLYLKGISSGYFPEALQALLGKHAKGFSASTVTRLKKVWEGDFREWDKRSLSGKRYVYMWADGIHFNVRLGEDDRMCILVIVGAAEDGKKELVAIEQGYRESELSWKNVLLSLRERGLERGPELAVADGALGFWKALEEIFPSSKQQACWVHKTANILDKMPKTKQPEAKKMIHEIYMAENKKDAEKALTKFQSVFEDKYPKAVKSLLRGKHRLLSFYDFPGVHWQHIRTTNPIESTFATVRLQTKRTKGCGYVNATVHMVFKLIKSAEKRWRKLRGYKLLADVIDLNVKFEDGVRKLAA